MSGGVPVAGEHIESLIEQSGGVGRLALARGREVGEENGTLLVGGRREAVDGLLETTSSSIAVAGRQGTVAGESIQSGRIVEVEPRRWRLVGGHRRLSEVD